MIIKGHNEIFEYICAYSNFPDFFRKNRWFMVAYAGSHNFSSWQTRPVVLVDFKYIIVSAAISLPIENHKILTEFSIESSYIDASHPMVRINVLPILYANFLYEIQSISIELEGNKYAGRLPK